MSSQMEHQHQPGPLLAPASKGQTSQGSTRNSLLMALLLGCLAVLASCAGSETTSGSAEQAHTEWTSEFGGGQAQPTEEVGRAGDGRQFELDNKYYFLVPVSLVWIFAHSVHIRRRRLSSDAFKIAGTLGFCGSAVLLAALFVLDNWAL